MEDILDALPNELLMIVLNYIDIEDNEPTKNMAASTIMELCNVSNRCYQLLPYRIKQLKSELAEHVRDTYSKWYNKWYLEYNIISLKGYIKTRTQYDTIYPGMSYSDADILDNYYNYVSDKILTQLEEKDYEVKYCNSCNKETYFCYCDGCLPDYF